MNTILTPVCFTALAGTILFLLLRMRLPFLRDRIVRRQLMRTGTEASATILAVSQTGLYLNKMPQLRLEVQVHPPGGRCFIAEIHHVLDFVRIPHFQKGHRVRVKYNPGNLKQVALVAEMNGVSEASTSISPAPDERLLH